MAFHPVDGALGSGEAVGLDFFEGSNVGLRRPDCGLRKRNLLRGEDGRENKRETEDYGQASDDH